MPLISTMKFFQETAYSEEQFAEAFNAVLNKIQDYQIDNLNLILNSFGFLDKNGYFIEYLGSEIYPITGLSQTHVINRFDKINKTNDIVVSEFGELVEDETYSYETLLIVDTNETTITNVEIFRDGNFNYLQDKIKERNPVKIWSGFINASTANIDLNGYDSSKFNFFSIKTSSNLYSAGAYCQQNVAVTFATHFNDNPNNRTDTHKVSITFIGPKMHVNSLTKDVSINGNPTAVQPNSTGLYEVWAWN